MKIVLLPTDKTFKANLAELHDATGASEPTEYRLVFRGENLTTRRIRLQGDTLYALSADGLHEVGCPLSEVSEVVAIWLPKHLLCIIAPNPTNHTASCAILDIHPTCESAEWHALDYLSDRGFQASNFTDLLQAVRNSKDFDIVREEI